MDPRDDQIRPHDPYYYILTCFRSGCTLKWGMSWMSTGTRASKRQWHMPLIVTTRRMSGDSSWTPAAILYSALLLCVRMETVSWWWSLTAERTHHCTRVDNLKTPPLARQSGTSGVWTNSYTGMKFKPRSELKTTNEIEVTALLISKRYWWSTLEPLGNI